MTGGRPGGRSIHWDTRIHGEQGHFNWVHTWQAACMRTRTTTWNLPGPSGIRDSLMQTSTCNFDIFLFLDFTAFLLSICFYILMHPSLYTFFFDFQAFVSFLTHQFPFIYFSTSFKKLFFLCSIYQTVPLLFLCWLQLQVVVIVFIVHLSFSLVRLKFSYNVLSLFIWQCWRAK